jgi:hypothetical protein
VEQLKRYVLLGSTVISLVALLAYNFFHTGAALARYVAPFEVGYVAAFGIETAVVSLSIRIGDLRKARRDSRLLVGVLIAVLLVSTLANISEGFDVQYGQPLTLGAVYQLDWLQGLIGFCMTGLISLVVFAMSEVVSVDVDTVVKEHERERKAAVRRATREDDTHLSNTEGFVLVSGAPAAPVGQARAVKAEQDTLEQTAREEHIYNVLESGEDPPNWSALARELGVSRQTVYNDRDRLQARGLIAEINGQWVTVNGRHAFDPTS